MSRTIELEVADEGRLDAVLAAAAGSRAAAQRLIEAGAVTVDGEVRTKPSLRVQAGSALVAVVPDASERESNKEAVPFDVVYEDASLMVVDKPAGVVVHPGAGWSGPTLAGALSGRARGGPDPSRAGIVHRLDRDTSGLLVVAKSDAIHAELQAMLRRREIVREYLTLVEGHPDADAGTIDAPLGRDRQRRTLQSTRTDRPREAVTHFTVIERLPRTSLLRVRLETGRTHQIRAHLAAIDHPVCGDRDYGGGPCGARVGLERQFLHAEKVMFSHPESGENLHCESKPPADLRRSLDAARREPVSGGPDGG